MLRALVRSLIAVGLIVSIGGSLRAEKNWPGWRGPHGDGHAEEQGLPIRWSADSIDWSAPLPGRGHSSPVIWEERIFLTTALDDGRQRVVMCLNRSDGAVLWKHVAWTGDPEPTHKMNGWASATCATDGRFVFAFFGKGGLHCYTVEGGHEWSKDLGDFKGPWGTAACPVLYGDTVIQNCDSDENAYIVAFDKQTGDEVWKTKREDFRCWSTPVMIEVAGRKELVLQGHTGVRAYDPETGKELWFVEGYRGRGSPTVTPGNGLLYVICGRPSPIYAIKPGGEGNVTDTHKAWVTERGGGRDLPSPIVVGDYVLGMNMQGLLACYDAKSGKELWKARIGGNFSSSPVSWAGLAFFNSEDGRTVVVKPSAKPEIVNRNRIGADDEEVFRASITPSDGQVFLRSDRKLYCIGRRKTK